MSIGLEYEIKNKFILGISHNIGLLDLNDFDERFDSFDDQFFARKFLTIRTTFTHVFFGYKLFILE